MLHHPAGGSGTRVVDARQPPPPLREETVRFALSKEAYRRILTACMEKARSVKDISEDTGLPLASTYRHVHALEDKGLLFVERSAMSPEGTPYDLYRSRITQMVMEVTAAGVVVRWEADEAVEDRLARMWRSMGL